VQQRPKDAEKDAQLTLRDIERIIVGFIVDRHNQALDARMGDQTRNQRWESGLIGDPPLISERELDICLMKTIRRTVHRGGNVQFENVMYQGEYLAGYAGKTVSIRYDPRDITTIWIYHQEENKEVFLTRAHAHDLETEQLSVDEAKASAKRVRSAGKSITNQAILYDVIDRSIDREAMSKPSRKQRREDEQAYKKSVTVTKTVEEIQTENLKLAAAELPVSEQTSDPVVSPSPIDDMEVWDYEKMRDDYGW
jgi:putative transposase